MPFAFNKTIDALIAFRIVKILVQDWVDMDAYRLGIIDKEGNALKKTRELKTVEEKKAYTKFHVIMFKLKKILEKLPFGKTKLGSLAVALMLLKEETNTRDIKLVESVIWNGTEGSETKKSLNTLCEQAIMDVDCSLKGSYTLKEETYSITGETIEAGCEISIKRKAGNIFGIGVYEAKTEDGLTIFVSKDTVE